MALARQTLDIDEGLAILTEMIVREIGPPSALANGEARAAAVARIERILETLMDDMPARLLDRWRDERRATNQPGEAEPHLAKTAQRR